MRGELDFVFFNIGSSMTNNVCECDNQRGPKSYDITKILQDYIEVNDTASMRKSYHRSSKIAQVTDWAKFIK